MTPALLVLLSCSLAVEFSASASVTASGSDPTEQAIVTPCHCHGRTTVSGQGFVISTSSVGQCACSVLASCVALRRDLHDTWLTGDALEWQPPCQVVIHATPEAYLRRLGAGARQTARRADVATAGGRVVRRRIDLVANGSHLPTALSHELTHVVLADHFLQQAPPPWFDEGVATLADAAEKRAAHRRDAHHAWKTGTALRLPELLRSYRPPAPSQRAAFYGQSLLLVDYLMEQGSPADLLRFVSLGERLGYEPALREVYGIASLLELEGTLRLK